MRLRKKRSTRVVSIDHTCDSDGFYRLDLIDQRDAPEDIVGSDEVLRMLTREIRRVPPVLREVLIMRYGSGLVMGKIAGQLGIGKQAAKSRLLRARIELRRRLRKHHGARGVHTLTQRHVTGKWDIAKNWLKRSAGNLKNPMSRELVTS